MSRRDCVSHRRNRKALRERATRYGGSKIAGEKYVGSCATSGSDGSLGIG
jgi:hypothetical protein